MIPPTKTPETATAKKLTGKRTRGAIPVATSIRAGKIDGLDKAAGRH